MMHTRTVLLSLACVLALAIWAQPVTETASPAESAALGAAQPGQPAALPRTPAPENAEVYIISPASGAQVSSPVRVVFGLRGAGVAPAGVQSPNTGHHHLLVDTDVPDVSRPIPADENHRHFGGGQTETTIELSPGQHRLQLLLGDHLHIPHDPPLMSDVVTIQVK